MNKEKVSICMLNIDRYWLSRYVIENNLSLCGVPLDEIEILILDNGSTDKRMIDYAASIADVHIIEESNIGVAKGYNKLFRIAKGDFICLPNTDIIMGKDWLKDLIYFNKKIEKSGITGIHCESDKGRLINYNGKMIWQRENNTIDGVTLFHKKMFEVVGGFDESFSKYGFEDNEYAIRMSLLGYANYYIPFQYGVHLGNDYNHNTEYRMQKNKETAIAKPSFLKKLQTIRAEKAYKIPL